MERPNPDEFAVLDDIMGSLVLYVEALEHYLNWLEGKGTGDEHGEVVHDTGDVHQDEARPDPHASTSGFESIAREAPPPQPWAAEE